MKLIASVFTTLFLMTVSFAQSTKIEDGWRGLRVFVTNKDTVDKILGKSLPIDDTTWTVYSLPAVQVAINFTGKPCSTARGEKGDYDVPEDTILEYIVSPKRPFPIKDLNWMREKYEVAPDRELYIKNYFDAQSGVWITTSAEKGAETVSQIWFRAPAGDKDKRRCKGKGN